MTMNLKRELDISRYMSYALRHQPDKCGLVLNKEGFCPLEMLLASFPKHSNVKNVTQEEVLEVVKRCSKQRYEIKDEVLIRARYGHSKANISYGEIGQPPKMLLHGTNEKVIDAVLQSGIKPMSRKYVHLSETPVFATLAGERRGRLSLVEVDTEKAQQAGVTFYYGGGEVWLSTEIPPHCLTRYKAD